MSLEEARQSNMIDTVKRPKEEPAGDVTGCASAAVTLRGGGDGRPPSSSLNCAKKPITFPVRLMQLMQRKEIPDGFYWLEGGKRFAIHSVKVLPVIHLHFQGE